MHLSRFAPEMRVTFIGFRISTILVHYEPNSWFSSKSRYAIKLIKLLQLIVITLEQPQSFFILQLATIVTGSYAHRISNLK